MTAAYGPANEMTSLSYYGYNETRTYNNLLQLTRQTVPGKFDTQYIFPAGQNNGQISAEINYISGQTVNYTYDSLKRLSTAGTSGAGWGQAYTYDGFGNLTAATVTQGSGVNFAQAYDPATNHAVGNVQFAYDANGNETWPSASYDEENRMITPDGYKTYAYDPWGKRVWESTSGTLYFYDIFGKQIWTSVINTPSVYFGNRLVVSQNAGVVTDRLGSVRYSGGQAMSYLPYGVEQTSTPNGQVKFGTYLRDGNSSTLGADYADQRYYNPWFGRFNSPDSRTGNFANSTTWNKYAYSDGDPVNRNDPTGQYSCFAGYGPEGDPEYTECEDESVYLPGSPGAEYICIFWGWGCPDFAALQAMQYYPFAPKSKPDLKFGGDVTKTFQNAWSNAWDDLKKVPCANDFGGPSMLQLQSTLADANYQYFPVYVTDLNSPNYGKVDRNVIAATNPATQTVTINNQGGFADFNGSYQFTMLGQTGTVSADQYRTFTLLHELGHLIGLGTEPDANGYDNAFNKSILQDCLGVKFK